MREVDRAELEALLQVKIEVSTDLREKLKSATDENASLSKTINAQQEKIAVLDLRHQLHEQPTTMTQVEVEELLQWKATVLGAVADMPQHGDDEEGRKQRVANVGGSLEDAQVVVDLLKQVGSAMNACETQSTRADQLEMELVRPTALPPKYVSSLRPVLPELRRGTRLSEFPS